MIKSHEEEKVTTEIVVDDIICNCCGQPIKKHAFDVDTTKPFDIPDDYLEINKEWGYFSDYDYENHKAHICQTCYKKWIDSFKIPIEVKEVEC